MLSARPFAFNEDGAAQIKTPGRTLKGRNALQENLHRGTMTVAAKSKNALTPHRPLTARAQKTLRDSSKPALRVTRPLGDKTPFPNRVANAAPFQTPAPVTGKLAKLSLLEPALAPAITPGALLRPSSARKSLRVPRTSGSGKALEFKTPITQGNHWDVSDGDMQIGPEVGAEEKETVQEEDYDEIEYMPPTAIIPPYEPPFEMPDYKEVGRTLLELAYSAKWDDYADWYYAADIEVEIDPQEVWRESGFISSPSKWASLELPDLEDDDPFPPKRATTTSSKATALPIASNVTASSKPTIRPTAIARNPSSNRTTPTALSTRAPSRAATVSRPATSTSLHNPPSKLATTRSAAASKATVRADASTSASVIPRPATSMDSRSMSGARKPTHSTIAKQSAVKPSAFATTTGATTVARRMPPSTSSTANRTTTGAARRTVSSATNTSGPASSARNELSRGALVPKSSAGTKSQPAKTSTAGKARAVEDDILLVFDDTASGLMEDFAFDV